MLIWISVWIRTIDVLFDNKGPWGSDYLTMKPPSVWEGFIKRQNSIESWPLQNRVDSIPSHSKMLLQTA